MNAYRRNLDAARLQEAINGEALVADNGLYISMADGFQTHDFKTQSVTSDCLLLLPSLVVLLTCVFYIVDGLASRDLSSKYFGRRFNHQPIAIIDLHEPSNTVWWYESSSWTCKANMNGGFGWRTTTVAPNGYTNRFWRVTLLMGLQDNLRTRCSNWKLEVRINNIVFVGTKSGKGGPTIVLVANATVAVSRPPSETKKRQGVHR